MESPNTLDIQKPPQVSRLTKFLVGTPIKTEDAEHQAISKKVGLAVFASDNLSSVAYATQEILIVLAAVGAGWYWLSIPISCAIVILLVLLAISYRQTIFAYPSGGGAYVVARDNLGIIPAQIAGAALLTDYILTVAVSVASGIAQVASLFKFIQPYRVEICVVAVFFMMMINLRGVKESGTFFALPTYFFIGTMAITLLVGLVRWLTGTLSVVQGVEAMAQGTEQMGLFLLLRAFSSGCAAVTGVEAISNGVQAFKEPKSKNAAQTLMVMVAFLGFTFIGTSLLAHAVHAVPSEIDTIIFQVGTVVLGPFVPILIAGTTLILILAANTAFADFPRLAALQAADGFLPRQLAFRGSRLVFSWGIIVLSVAAMVLIAVFDAEVTNLIPLYAIGVFLSFTLSQFGMVVHWQRASALKPGESHKSSFGTVRYDAGWRIKQVINFMGGTISVIVMIVFAIAKFSSGAWITVILIPVLVFLFLRVNRHYKDVAQLLSLSKKTVSPHPRDLMTLVLVDDVHAGTVNMVEYAMSLGADWIPVHIDDDHAKTEIIKHKWAERMSGCAKSLHIVSAPYRDLTQPVLNMVEGYLSKHTEGFVHIVMGQLIMDSWAGQALHANTTVKFKLALQRMDRVVVTDVSYRLHTEDVASAPPNETNDYAAPQEQSTEHPPA